MNIPPRKLFKLFFGIKKPKPKPKRIVNIKQKKINSSSQSTKKDKTISSLNIKNDTSNPIIDNSNNMNIQEIKVEKENINDISVIKENNNSNELNEDLSTDKKIFNFEGTDTFFNKEI